MYALSDFDFDLPPERIAQLPLAERSASRLLHLDGATIIDRQFADIVDLLTPGDLLVMNDTRVLKARFFGVKDSGGQVEVLVERILDTRTVLAQVRASKSPKPGCVMRLADAFEVRTGERAGEFFTLHFDADVFELIEAHGRLPLPPYIEHTADAFDENRYQTVYSRAPGAVAAPTAGLHFDEQLLARLAAKGVQVAYVTLHVGAGTFQPVRTEVLSEHKMHTEWYTVPQATVDAVAAARAAGRAVVAVGTTSLRVLAEIRADLGQVYPMQRLLQGDVGSGKTVVAALAAAQAMDSGYQAALMAPTEILADQHFRKIAAWMAPLGVQVAWLTGSLKKKDKLAAQALAESGQAQLVIGTHALIQEAVQFARLGLVIVDEQHRFGVGQRLTLRNKGGEGVQPHQLMMSATPIPRTLAMTYYADLEVSVIDQLPPGRSPIVTRAVDQERRDEVIARVHAAAHEGRQVYWVCPLIEESEALQLQTATDTHAMLALALPDLRVGLVHGRLKSQEKQDVMDAFARREVDVLVATTVIEVGVDVPNATLMVIEHAERFGLSQLHQLRGRVGRGSAASVCLLLYQSPLGPVARQRLMTMRESTDGFEIARRDLELRGPGEFLGARQSGQAMLRFADLETDQWLVDQARDVAHRLLQGADDAATVDAHLARWLGGREDFLKV